MVWCHKREREQSEHSIESLVTPSEYLNLLLDTKSTREVYNIGGDCGVVFTQCWLRTCSTFVTTTIVRQLRLRIWCTPSRYSIDGGVLHHTWSQSCGSGRFGRETRASSCGQILGPGSLFTGSDAIQAV